MDKYTHIDSHRLQNISIQWISILISSYNTLEEYLKECFHSILLQKDLGIKFAIEIVVVNDGSNEPNTEILESILTTIEKEIRLDFIRIKYLKMPTNKGLSYCLHHGVLACTYDLIFRMDSDDIMEESRITKQIDFMNKEPSCVLLGTNLLSFIVHANEKKILGNSAHEERITWEEYKKTKKQWIMNHPTLCFRKYAVITVGNYNANLKEPFEDLDLELRLLKKYGFICNLPEILLFYRIHPNQITSQNRDKTFINTELKAVMIENIIFNYNF